MPDVTVLQFLEENKFSLPRFMSVQRAKNSKYFFYLLIRHYKNRLGLTPTFLSYSKEAESMVRSVLEEHSVLQSLSLYVLEDFGKEFFKTLRLPEDVYVLAEIDQGELILPTINYRKPRDILKVLMMRTQLDLENYSLRALLENDWTAVTSFEGYEPILRRAKILGLTEAKIGEFLKGVQWENILSEIKVGDLSLVFDMEKRLGADWIWNSLAKTITQTVHIQSLQRMGYDDKKVREELDLGYKMVELLEAAKRYTLDDLDKMVRYYISLDSLVSRRPDLGLALFLFKNPTRLVR